MKLNFASASTLALIPACAAPSLVMAQEANVDEIIVTGTRTTGLRAVDSRSVGGDLRLLLRPEGMTT